MNLAKPKKVKSCDQDDNPGNPTRNLDNIQLKY